MSQKLRDTQIANARNEQEIQPGEMKAEGRNEEREIRRGEKEEMSRTVSIEREGESH